MSRGREMSASTFLVRDKTGFLLRRPRRILSAASVLAVVGIWEAAGRCGLVSPLFLPPFSDVLAAGYGMILSGEIFGHLGASLWRIGWGFFMGAFAGVSAGLLLGFSQASDDLANPLIAATYPIPKIALLPLLILWLGIGEAPKVAIIGLGVFFPIVMNTRAGVRNIDPLLIRAALSLGSTRFRTVFKVILPASLPMIFAGLKLGIGIALLLVVTAEMIAADKGIGYLVLSAANLMETPRLLFGIMVLSGLGLLLSWGLEKVERLLVPWK